MFLLEARQVGLPVCRSRHSDRITNAKINVVALAQFSRASTSLPTLASANYFPHPRERAKTALANPLGINRLQMPHLATRLDSHTYTLPGGYRARNYVAKKSCGPGSPRCILFNLNNVPAFDLNNLPAFSQLLCPDMLVGLDRPSVLFSHACKKHGGWGV